MKKVLVLTLILLQVFKLNAQGFRGSIEFKYYTLKDTALNMYYVKDKVVKLDQFKKRSTTVEGSYIFDLKNNTIRFVSPQRKVWGEHKSEIPPNIKGVFEVIKGKNTSTIAGVKCKEYIVKNNEENTVITYLIADSKYNFFIPMMKLWNRKDRQSIYFAQIKDLPEGSMPFFSEEKQISDGRSITKLEVLKVSNKAPEDSFLEVPASYSKID